MSAIAKSGALTTLSQRLNIDEAEMHGIVFNTLMKAKDGKQVTNEEFVTFLAIASEYKLNPLTKEIYAFSHRGAIQPIVSIDGWLKIINQHNQFDGMEFSDQLDETGNLTAVTCKIYRKDRQRPTEVTEYMNECKGTSDPWKKWPARMLRHKATIQCARYAFGLSGIVDPDEAERIQSTVVSEPKGRVIEYYPAADFETNFPKWEAAISSGRKAADQIIQTVESKALLTDEQKQLINNVAGENNGNN